LFFAKTVTAAPGSVVQASAGAQSPVISGVDGNVSITSGVPQNVVDYLMERIRDLEAGLNAAQKRDFEVNEKQKLLEELAAKYRDLQQRLEQEAGDDKLVKQSAELLQQGRLEEAGKSLDQLISIAGQNLASHHFSRGQIFDLEFKPLQALTYYEQACYLDPGKSEYSFAYARMLQKQNEFGKAETLYQQVLERCRELAKDNPAAYLSDVATTLNNLGLLYANTQRLEAAGQAFEEALKIRRELARDNPAAYLPDVAMTLNNLGNLYADTQRLEAAGQAYEEALKIRRELAKDNPAAYLDDVAMTLNNLRIFCEQAGKMAEAGEMAQELERANAELEALKRKTHSKRRPDKRLPESRTRFGNFVIW
jgi:tetratricopeptide (TPR) repeat protein